MRTKDLVKFMTAREAARERREGAAIPWKLKLPKPDPIITRYRFCNMDRNDDRVTKFIFAWAARFTGHEDLWFAFVVARLLNLPASLMAVEGCVLPWTPKRFVRILHERKAAGANNFNAAYIVSTNGRAMDKVEYLVRHVLDPLWAARKAMRPRPSDTLSLWHARLIQFDGMGSFMAAQVVADLKYFPGPLREAADFFSFAASGPGSRRGMNRVMGRGPLAPVREPIWRRELDELRTAVVPALAGTHLENITAQNLQNCLCEFDKYERARLGEQPPKQIYTPHKEK